MRLNDLLLLAVLVAAVAMTGCDDGGGGGGTGGAAGSGGTAGSDGTACTAERCEATEPRAACALLIEECNRANEAELTSEQCESLGDFVFCEPQGGTGGAGGAGGTGGRGAVVCVEDACADSASQEAKCRSGLRFCTDEALNVTECADFVDEYFCRFMVSEVFVTQGTFNGDLGGLAGGDDACTTAAAAAGLPGGWTAWLSTDAEDARDRIPNVQYELLDGAVIATDKADLTDGTIDVAINVDENGAVVTDLPFTVWTGTAEDGTHIADDDGLLPDCQEWTSMGALIQGRTGTDDVTDDTWTDLRDQDCDIGNRLYCFFSP